MSDLISRQSVLKEIDKACRRYPNSFYNGLSIAADIVAKQLSAERPNGKWTFDSECVDWKCSECGKHSMEYGRYCCNCGAEMEMEDG